MHKRFDPPSYLVIMVTYLSVSFCIRCYSISSNTSTVIHNVGVTPDLVTMVTISHVPAVVYPCGQFLYLLIGVIFRQIIVNI